MNRLVLPCIIAALAAAPIATLPAQRPPATGYTDTPFLPGDRWRVHDDARPRPRIVEPSPAATGSGFTAPPADAIVLFDGTDLSGWEQRGRGGGALAAAWKIDGDAMVVVPGTGSHRTKQSFGDIQLHIEWATPAAVDGSSQARGNSGVLIMELYEIQILDSYDNISYADGQAGAIYGQFPPLVNAARPPGEWQAYDIVFEAPRFEDGELTKPAFITVFHNGVLLHHRRELMGPMRHKAVSEYRPHAARKPLLLQAHGNPVRYRNIWVRELDLGQP